MASAMRSEKRPKPSCGYMKLSIRETTLPFDGTIASLTAVTRDMPFERWETQSPLIWLQGRPQTFSE